MAVAWPATVPIAIQVDGYQETMPKNTIRTQMEAGPAKLRRRSTAAPTMIQARQIYNASQTTDFVTFFNATTKMGSLDFTWTNPRTAAVVTARFVGEPTVTPEGPISWMVSYQLEVLP